MCFLILKLLDSTLAVFMSRRNTSGGSNAVLAMNRVRVQALLNEVSSFLDKVDRNRKSAQSSGKSVSTGAYQSLSHDEMSTLINALNSVLDLDSPHDCIFVATACDARELLVDVIFNYVVSVPRSTRMNAGSVRHTLLATPQMPWPLSCLPVTLFSSIPFPSLPSSLASSRSLSPDRMHLSVCMSL